MKDKKFKIDRSRIESVQKNLIGMSYRSKLMMEFVIRENIEEEYHLSLLSVYRQAIMKLFSKTMGFLKNNDDPIIILKKDLELFDYYINVANTVEDLFSESGKYSLRVH